MKTVRGVLGRADGAAARGRPGHIGGAAVPDAATRLATAPRRHPPIPASRSSKPRWVDRVRTARSTNRSDHVPRLVGNRPTRTHTGPGGGGDETNSYQYNGDDQLTVQDSSHSGETDFTYDLNGSQFTSTHGSNATASTYNTRNKVVVAVRWLKAKPRSSDPPSPSRRLRS
jgi:hypothetical protein